MIIFFLYLIVKVTNNIYFTRLPVQSYECYYVLSGIKILDRQMLSLWQISRKLLIISQITTNIILLDSYRRQNSPICMCKVFTDNNHILMHVLLYTYLYIIYVSVRAKYHSGLMIDSCVATLIYRCLVMS